MGPYGPQPGPGPNPDLLTRCLLLFLNIFHILSLVLGPGPGWGPYGPIRALMLVFKSEAFRVQTAPFEKIRTDLWRSPDTSTHLRPSGSQKTKA